MEVCDDSNFDPNPDPKSPKIRKCDRGSRSSAGIKIHNASNAKVGSSDCHGSFTAEKYFGVAGLMRNFLAFLRD